jgi:hypothetical protein
MITAVTVSPTLREPRLLGQTIVIGGSSGSSSSRPASPAHPCRRCCSATDSTNVATSSARRCQSPHRHPRNVAALAVYLMTNTALTDDKFNRLEVTGLNAIIRCLFINCRLPTASLI